MATGAIQLLRAHLSAELGRRKVSLLNQHYHSQRFRDWWDDETFRTHADTRYGMQEPLCRSVSSVEGCSLAWDYRPSDPSPIHVVVTAAGAVGASIAASVPTSAGQSRPRQRLGLPGVSSG